MKGKKIKLIKKTKICFHIANISNCGGTEKVTTQISNLLLKYYSDKYEVYILSNYYDLSAGPFFKGNNNIKYFRLYEKSTRIRLKPFQTIEKIKEFVKNEKIDILIGVDTILSVFDIPALKDLNCKYVAWEHFNYYANLGVKMRDFGRKLSGKKADALVVLSQTDYDYFQQNLDINIKLVQIYNPFSLNTLNIKPYENRENIILSSGRLTSQKGFDLLIEVADKVREKNKNFKWIILGDGEDKELLLEKINDYHLEDFIELKGRVKNVEDYYNQSKFFVLTSRFEGLVLVVLEAKQYRLPVISFDCNCGPKEMINEGENGYLIPMFDIEKMANRIVELLENNEKCKFMSDNALKEMDKFDENVIIQKWHNLFIELLGDKK